MKTSHVVGGLVAVGALVAGAVYAKRKGYLAGFTGTAPLPPRPYPLQANVPRPPPAVGFTPPNGGTPAADVLAWEQVVANGVGIMGALYSAGDSSAVN